MPFETHDPPLSPKTLVATLLSHPLYSIGALIIRIGLGVYYTILIIIRNPQNPTLIMKAPTSYITRMGVSENRGP